MKSKTIFGRKVLYKKADLSDAGIEAFFCPETYTITFDKRLKGKQLLLTQLHEEMHVILNRIGVHQAGIPDGVEEIIVEAISTFICEHYTLKPKV